VKGLPPKRELLELLVLLPLVAGLRFAIGGWEWPAFFAYGYLWNWAMGNTWVRETVMLQKYRFSLLRGITWCHDQVVSRVSSRWRKLASILPAGFVLGVLSLLLISAVPWYASFLGSAGLVLIRSQLDVFP
jgi:hypothetical protein